jgi:hypothetical protein
LPQWYWFRLSSLIAQLNRSTATAEVNRKEPRRIAGQLSRLAMFLMGRRGHANWEPVPMDSRGAIQAVLDDVVSWEALKASESRVQSRS